ncbi:MAG: hypothetical protein HY586_01550 [Candidatus Omnitrophica bacterium]|nr:hypothetical protein [Candidatus Omnitrophota bacterium]
MARASKKTYMLGVGLDGDGHFRYTRGENFHLVGGSQETHKVLQEKAIKINEQLSKKGKSLEQVGAEEFQEIAHKAGLQPIPPQKKLPGASNNS